MASSSSSSVAGGRPPDGGAEGGGSSVACDGVNTFPELLDFCSRAQTLIAELLLLSERIPSQFLDRRFDPVLFDLRYFDSPSEFESRIEGNVELEAFEDQLRESCFTFMQRFFFWANGSIVYHAELVKYLNDLQEGLHMQFTLDTVIGNESGRQLVTESIVLFGCLLLLMEHHISGSLREKLLVSYVRYDHSVDHPNLDQIFSLCRTHRSSSSYQVTAPYLSSSLISVEKPEELLGRFPFPKSVVDNVICCLRNNDIYNQLCHYPDLQHRTVALSLQGGCMYVLLFYSTELLHDGFVMREIIDRFFKDLWVIPIFLHFVVDLFVSWDTYKEAKASLSSCLSPTFIRDRCQYHYSKARDFLFELHSLISDTPISKEYVLDNSQHLFALIRNCNVTLRWLLLHRTSIDKRSKDIVTSIGLAEKVDDDGLLTLLLKISQLEFELKHHYIELLEGKERLWSLKKNHVSGCMEELVGHDFGSSVFSCKFKNESLKDFFGRLSVEVHSLECAQPGISRRIIYQAISALKDVEQFHQIAESLQIKQRIHEIQIYLQVMIKILNSDIQALTTFSMVTDAIYAWGFVRRYDKHISMKIEKDPSVLLNLHAFFIKFQGFLNAPVLRLLQKQSPDLQCTSSYYSSQFSARICATLKILPVLLLEIPTKDGIQDQGPSDLSSRLGKCNLHNLVQLDQRHTLGRFFYNVCIISQGLTALSRSFAGLINLDIKNWLERQIRNELSKQIGRKLNSFCLPTIVRHENVEASISTLFTYISGQRQMMENIQDVLHMNGKHIWEETVAEVLRQCAQKEYAEFVKRKQDSIVSFKKLNDFSMSDTFFGHLLHQLLQLTEPSRSMFIEPMSGWFDAEGRELLGLHLFNQLSLCVGQVGMDILDSLLYVLIKENLEHALRTLKKLLDAGFVDELQKIEGCGGPSTSLPLSVLGANKQMVKIVNTSWESLIQCLATIGQLQLIRCMVCFKMRSACKIKASLLTSATEGVVASIHAHRQGVIRFIEEKPEENASSTYFLHKLYKQLSQLTHKMDRVERSLSQAKEGTCVVCRKVGIPKVTKQKMMQTTQMHQSPCVERSVNITGQMVDFYGLGGSKRKVEHIIERVLPRYVLDNHLGTLTSRLKNSVLDFSPVVIGVGTFLRQFHASHMTQYVQYMGQYVQKITDISVYEHQETSINSTPEVLKSAFWLMCFCKYMGIPKVVVDSCLSPSLIAVLQS